LPTFECNSIDALFLKDAYLFFECELYQIVDGFDDYSIITGKILNAFVDKHYMKVSEKDNQEQIIESPLLAYIANGRFAKIKKTFNFPFPKGFKK
jgi:flavin reductase (DIM6/NTAB) family NADH-FMN oxidoreductase RutF